jgi:hypothetical protein
LSQLDKYRTDHSGKYPEELYIQVDGGSENANNTLLAALELLVIKRMVRIIHYSRLPTGHTHEDIDACFGNIKKFLNGRHFNTLDDFSKVLTEGFKDSKIPLKVVDVMVVPDYVTFFENCIDSELACLHKELQTQHQWRFQAVEPSTFFPFGCKTTYRAYSSDKVIEHDLFYVTYQFYFI